MALDPEPGLHGLQAVFGPDGATVVFARGSELIEKTIEKGEERVIYSDRLGRAVRLPAISVHGRAFVAGSALYVERNGEIGRTKLLELPSGRFTDVAWTPDGEALIVGTEGDQGAKLFRVSSAGDAMTPIETPADRVPGITIHPTGRTFAYAAGSPTEEVWVLDHATEVD